MYTVYVITCLANHYYYVGQTSRSLEVRYDEHWVTSKRYNYKNFPMYKDFNKYGRDNFKVERLGEYKTADEANIWEIYYIAQYARYLKLYNGTGGGGYKAPSGDSELVQIISLFKHQTVKIYKSYWEAAKDLNTTSTAIICACIDKKPIGKYWITFKKDLSQLMVYLHTPAGKSIESHYWANNYSWEAKNIKRKYNIDPDMFTYTSALWTMDNWKNER